MKRKAGKKKCRKVAYHSPDAARAALRRLRFRGAKRFYPCPHCPGIYHLTSEPRG